MKDLANAGLFGPQAERSSVPAREAETPEASGSSQGGAKRPERSEVALTGASEGQGDPAGISPWLFHNLYHRWRRAIKSRRTDLTFREWVSTNPSKGIAGRPRHHEPYQTYTFTSWSQMMARCYAASVANGKDAKYYVDKGIEVCERWRNFQRFFEDMGERPPGLTLDRIDGNKGYEPGNCRWATRAEQMTNRTWPKKYNKSAKQKAKEAAGRHKREMS